MRRCRAEELRLGVCRAGAPEAPLSPATAAARALPTLRRRTVQNKYEGAFVYARTPDVPKEALPSIYRLAEEAGLDPSTFCKVRNSCGVPGKLGPELIGVEGVLAEELPEQRAASVPSNPLVLSSLQLWYELTDFLEDPHYAGSYILQQQERMPPVQAIQGLGQGLGESASGAASSGSP